MLQHYLITYDSFIGKLSVSIQYIKSYTSKKIAMNLFDILQAQRSKCHECLSSAVKLKTSQLPELFSI